MPLRLFKMQIDDVAIMSLANKTTWTGWLTSVAATVADWGLTAIGGFIAAVGGMLVNWYYRHKDHKRKSLETAARIAALKTQSDDGVSP